MTRVKQGYTTQRRQKKIQLFASTFISAHSRLTRTTTQQRMRALVSSHRDRSRKKRDFCHLWIIWINAVTCEDRLFYTYSLLIHNLYNRQLLLNCKILVQIALSNKNYFDIISNKIINKKEYKSNKGIKES